MSDYKTVNKDLWNKWAKLHVDSKFYNMEAFREGRTSLQSIELALLKNIKGKRVLHLQCHFGQDSLSMTRLGAKVTGVDISDEAVFIAQNLAKEMELDAQFVCSDVLELDKNLEDQFDYIFTSYGALVWLPDLYKWASIVDHFLKPGGELIVVEFHPVSNMFDENFEKILYSYFRREGILEEEEGSYAALDATDVKGQSLAWDFSISDLMTPVLQQGFQIESFMEYDFSPYDLYKQSTKTDHGFQVKGKEGKVPLVFSLVASKPK